MGKGILWNGKYFVLPQAASRIDSSALNAVQLGSDNKLAILGTMTGLLAPKTITRVSTPSLASMLIHPDCEEARLAVQLAFSPSPGEPGASEVILVPVNPSVRGTATFGTSYTATSHIYGLPANQVKVKQENGTTTGKKVTVAYMTETETFDNLTRSVFSIQYTGAGSAATMTINVAAATHLLTTTVTGAADNLSLDLQIYNTIRKLVDAVNATGKYTATILCDQPDLEVPLNMDNVTAQDVKTAAYTVKSDLQAIIDTVNLKSAYVVLARVTDATAAPANFAWTFLSGGANGTITNNDWQEAFDLLKTTQVNFIVPLSNSSSIHTMGDAHVAWMSGPNGKSERRQFVGGALQSWANESARTTAIAAIKTAIKALNSDRSYHACLGSYHYDPNGVLKLYPAYITASMYAGIAAGGSPVKPLTRKYLRCYGLEVELRVAEIDEILEAGGMAPIPDNVQGAGYVVSRQVSTWSQDNDLYRIEFSVGRGADYIAAEVRRRHELLVGQPGDELMDLTIINLTNAVLQTAKRDGYIRSYDPKKTQIRADGTIRYVDYSADPVLPINWIFGTYHVGMVSFVL